jgi:hypothetical protein
MISLVVGTLGGAGVGFVVVGGFEVVVVVVVVGLDGVVVVVSVFAFFSVDLQAKNRRLLKKKKQIICFCIVGKHLIFLEFDIQY